MNESKLAYHAQKLQSKYIVNQFSRRDGAEKNLRQLAKMREIWKLRFILSNSSSIYTRIESEYR